MITCTVLSLYIKAAVYMGILNFLALPNYRYSRYSRLEHTYCFRNNRKTIELLSENVIFTAGHLASQFI